MGGLRSPLGTLLKDEMLASYIMNSRNIKNKLAQWFTTDPIDGIYSDKVGNANFPTSARVGGWYLSAGTISTDLISTALSYTDATTLLSVDSTTDASGDFTVPVNGIVDLTIDGHYFPIEESTGDYIGATDGTYYGIATATWVQSDAVPSYADEYGYTPSDGSTMYWDIDTTIPIPSGVNITSGAGFIG